MFITRWIDEKRGYRRYKARKEQLPAKYREVLDAVQRYVFYFASGNGHDLQSLLNDLADLFEEAATSRTPIQDIVGEDPWSSSRSSCGITPRLSGSPRSGNG